MNSTAMRGNNVANLIQIMAIADVYDVRVEVDFNCMVAKRVLAQHFIAVYPRGEKAVCPIQSPVDLPRSGPSRVHSPNSLAKAHIFE